MILVLFFIIFKRNRFIIMCPKINLKFINYLKIIKKLIKWKNEKILLNYTGFASYNIINLDFSF